MAGQIRTPSAESIGARRAAIVSCWLCGIALHYSQMVPDGGSACLDIRWYCQDTWACTERWTSARPVISQTAGTGGNPAAGSATRRLSHLGVAGPCLAVTPVGDQPPDALAGQPQSGKLELGAHGLPGHGRPRKTSA